jgi:hypothetical protein
LAHNPLVLLKTPDLRGLRPCSATHLRRAKAAIVQTLAKSQTSCWPISAQTSKPEFWVWETSRRTGFVKMYDFKRISGSMVWQPAFGAVAQRAQRLRAKTPFAPAEA